MTTHANRTDTEPVQRSVAFADDATLQEISRHLERLTDSARQRTANYSRHGAKLWAQLGERLATGKLARPGLVMLGYEAFGGRHRRQALDLACAFELLHNALIIHDDIIDRDFLRRGAPTISALYRDEAAGFGRSRADAEHAGNSAALIAGDLLLSEAIKVAGRAAAGLDNEEQVEACFFQAIEQAGAGELEDLLFSLNPHPATTADVLHMEELKTAAYSFQLPLQAGALLAGADALQAQLLGTIGSKLGVAYQVIDDVLGTFGNPQDTGKPADSDLREFKSTILLSLAAEDPQFAALLQEFRAGRVSAHQVRQAMAQQDAETFARELARQLCTSATRSAAFLRLPEDAQSRLHHCTRLILERSW
ncbi:polyprenyl synthetase family protein [Glutamicibacter protophormiae]|uniref:Geranylgeranyl diphosphate synthase type II n=1 Tax=Glutamicibacter protophormiae TaxID=37930 RepID=A0ABS4XS70_GLUPR|nr:polyprenyl synthetase family protein [Glutamicibacter protophormiae]MBP2399355.1 geranylgeranyl diphosphate synthase type II [Glutamicibacter protophormiae]GGL85480.1 geranylgeranyl pyrophosphate synthase [Glutamicibacter protophormiae]